MYDIHVMSFDAAAVYSCLEGIPPTIIVSIDDLGFPLTPFDEDNVKILSVCKVMFSDTVDEKIGMTEDDARKIVSFVSNWRIVHPSIVVHCAAGVSRSAGVAAGLSKWLNGDDTAFSNSPYFNPNILCYTRILDAAGVPYDLEAVQHLFEERHRKRDVMGFGTEEWFEQLHSCYEHDTYGYLQNDNADWTQIDDMMRDNSNRIAIRT